MKIIPRRIADVKLLHTNTNTYGIYIESDRKNVLFTGTLKENADYEILNTLVNKNAYASALLYFIENFEIKEDINQRDLLEDINILMHSRCKVINEKAPLLIKIGEYPLYEAEKYILRGDGDNKIKESFKEEIDIKDITEEYLKTRKFDDIIKDFVVCPKCKNVFEEEILKTDYEDYPDDYSGDINNEPISYECPYCGYSAKNEEVFSDAWVDDLESAPNISEYIDSNKLEEDGTQAADITSKVDYTFQSAPTPANPKKKYKPVEIKELDESTYLNLSGFIKDVDGFYKRGNYVLVRESDTNKLEVINKSKLSEEVADTGVGPEDIANYIQEKLNKKFPNRFKIKSGEVEPNCFGLVVTDNNNHNAGDLIDVTDAINILMANLQYDKKDYEIDYKKNNLIMAIYNPKKIYSSDFSNK